MADHDTRLADIAARASLSSTVQGHIDALAKLAGPGLHPHAAEVLTEFFVQAAKANRGVTRTERHEAALVILLDAAIDAYTEMLEE